MELLNIYNDREEFIGTATRKEVHSKGLWHKIFLCCIFRPNNKMLIQLRQKIKEENPNLLDVAAGGHLQAGEDEMISGLREIEEEIGLYLEDDSRLIYCGKYKKIKENVEKNYFNKEIINVYFLKDSTPLTEYKMQTEEVDALFEIDISNGINFFSGEQEIISIEGCLRDSTEIITRNVTVRDFVTSTSGNIWLKLFIMGQKIVDDTFSLEKDTFK